MNRKNKKAIIALGLVIVLFIGFSAPSISNVLGKNDKPKKPKKKAKEISVSLEYQDHVFHDPDVPIVGIAYNVYDGANILIGSGITTDSLGMMTFIVLMAYDETGLGIHIEYRNSFRIFIKIMWQGTLVSINNLAIGESRDIELDNFGFTFIFEWDDSSPIVGDNIEVWQNGNLLDTKTTDASGFLNMNGIIDGTYTLISIGGLFADIVYIASVNHSDTRFYETFTISAQFKRVSRFLVK